MLTLKLCKGSWTPHIQYPEGATSSTSVMAMTDAECVAEMRKMAYEPDESQDRETVEDEFPCLGEPDVASEDPYESPR